MWNSENMCFFGQDTHCKKLVISCLLLVNHTDCVIAFSQLTNQGKCNIGRRDTKK